MADRREFEGNSIDEAIITASRELGIPIDDLHYELLEEGRKGVFGLGARQVRIRVELPAEQAARRERQVAPEPEPTSPERHSVEETLDRMFRLMGLDLNVQTKQSGSNLRVELGGADRPMLLQKDGQLLSALHFLLNRMARRAWPDVGRIQVRCDGHHDRRDEELVELVREVASQVARTGEAKRLHPMNPYERRLAHITVREFSGLTSRSHGDGFLKTITVAKS